MRKLLPVLLLFFGISIFAQVGIGTTTPDSSSELHIESTNRGLLIPRVALVNVTNGLTPINTPATSLLVYNTNAAVTGGTGLGYYFWNGTLWEKLASGSVNDHDWYEVGSTISPNDINDNIYTTNNVGINVSNPGAYQLLVGDDALPALQLGAYTLNNTESGRLVFGEGVNTYVNPGTYCGIEFRYDGTLNSLFLEGACTTPLNIATFERTGDVGIATNNPTEQLEIGGTNSNLFMNSLTSNSLRFNTEGVAVPSFTTRSLGTKIVLYPQVSATSSDYAIGIAGSTFWHSIPQATNAFSYRWYNGVTEGMRFRGDGRLGIGIAAPTATRLQAYDPSMATSRVAIFRNGTVDGTEVQFGSVEYVHDYASTTDFNDGANSVGLTINYNATSGYDLQLAFNSAAKPTSGSWTIASDRRLKEDINPFNDGLTILKKINPVYFKYNGNANTPKDDYGIGVIAQEIKEIAPYMVGVSEYLPDEVNKSNIEEYLSYNPDALHYININAIKELDDKISSLESQLKNISDFGLDNLTEENTRINFSNDFVSNLSESQIPIITITPIQSNANLYIVSQDKNGFVVRKPEGLKEVKINWIAMGKVNKSEPLIKENSNEYERNVMISKVKLPKTRMRERIKRENQELIEFKKQLNQAELDDLRENTPNDESKKEENKKTKLDDDMK